VLFLCRPKVENLHRAPQGSPWRSKLSQGCLLLTTMRRPLLFVLYHLRSEEKRKRARASQSGDRLLKGGGKPFPHPVPQ